MLKIKSYNLYIFIIMFLGLNGCVLTKFISVPMRLGGAVASIVPIVGETMHTNIDKAAEKVDDIPL